MHKALAGKRGEHFFPGRTITDEQESGCRVAEQKLGDGINQKGKIFFRSQTADMTYDKGVFRNFQAQACGPAVRFRKIERIDTGGDHLYR